MQQFIIIDLEEKSVHFTKWFPDEGFEDNSRFCIIDLAKETYSFNIVDDPMKEIPIDHL